MVPGKAGTEAAARLRRAFKATVELGGIWRLGNREGLEEMCMNLRDGRDPRKTLHMWDLTPAPQEAAHCLSAK